MEESKTHRNNIEKVRRLQPKDSDNELLDVKVTIPDVSYDTRFSWRKLWAFSGPGFLMSIAFLDPGNIEADLQSGVVARFQLFWVLLWATFLGLLVQRLSARVGVVTGQHMAEICHSEYRTIPRLATWIMMEIAIIGSDMQEVIGTAISIYLLSKKVVPLYGGVLITVMDTLTFIFLDKYGLRKLELFFAVLISTMAITFGIEYFLILPNFGEVMEGIVVPYCKDCGHEGLLQAVGIVGACIMPHNLYLHSGLVKTREIDRSQSKKISEANFYFLIESAIALFVSFIINLFVMAVFAQGMHGKTDASLHGLCAKTDNPFTDAFSTSNQTVQADIYKAGAFLGCNFGLYALYIWAVGILAAGQSSTMTGCYAGQFTMEGFLNLTWVRWKRVLFTRSMALLPTLWVALAADLSSFSRLNDVLNALMSIQLPFAVLPAIAFSSNTRIMGEFANGITNKIIAVLIFILIMIINIMLLSDFWDNTMSKWPVWALVILAIYGIVYILVTIYLAIHCIAALTSPHSYLNQNSFMQKYILGKSITEARLVTESETPDSSTPRVPSTFTISDTVDNSYYGRNLNMERKQMNDLTKDK